MSTPYIGEIRIFAGNYAPQGWAFCDGSLLSISEFDTLFNLIGTTYGGDGQTTFALPDLRGRIPVHQGAGFVLGQSGGAEAVTLTTAQLPAHTHLPQAQSTPATSRAPGGNVWAVTAATRYSPAPLASTLDAGAIQAAGGGQPHDNLMPGLCVNFIISLFGIFPSQN